VINVIDDHYLMNNIEGTSGDEINSNKNYFILNVFLNSTDI